MRKNPPDLKLLQEEVALILGIEEATISNSENNQTSPSLHCIPRVVEFLGYSPFNLEPKTLRERMVNCGRLLGITQKELAGGLGIDPTTLARWERDDGRPTKR